MKGIVIASHGKMAEGLLDTLSLFVGTPEQVETVCLLASDDVTLFQDRLKEAINKVDSGDGVVLFCDLLFGTPCNQSALIIRDENYASKVEVVTGMNLGMILEYTTSRLQKDTANDIDGLISKAKEGIVNFKKMVLEQK